MHTWPELASNPRGKFLKREIFSWKRGKFQEIFAISEMKYGKISWNFSPSKRTSFKNSPFWSRESPWDFLNLPEGQGTQVCTKAHIWSLFFWRLLAVAKNFEIFRVFLKNFREIFWKFSEQNFLILKIFKNFWRFYFWWQYDTLEAQKGSGSAFFWPKDSWAGLLVQVRENLKISVFEVFKWLR